MRKKGRRRSGGKGGAHPSGDKQPHAADDCDRAEASQRQDSAVRERLREHALRSGDRFCSLEVGGDSWGRSGNLGGALGVVPVEMAGLW